MAAERIRECGDDLRERKFGGVEEWRCLDHHPAPFFSLVVVVVGRGEAREEARR